MADGYHGDYCPDCPTRRKQADEIERLRAALKFYADPAHYTDRQRERDDPTSRPMGPATTSIEADGGARARALLSENGTPKGDS